jgi:hypothetical protein
VGRFCEVDVGRVGVAVVADPHSLSLTPSATSWRYNTSDSRRLRQRRASLLVLPSARFRSW